MENKPTTRPMFKAVVTSDRFNDFSRAIQENQGYIQNATGTNSKIVTFDMPGDFGDVRESLENQGLAINVSLGLGQQ